MSNQQSQRKQPNTLSATLAWFEAARPTPTNKQFHTQLGVHFEEVAEMLDALTAVTAGADWRLHEARVALKALAQFLKTNPNSITVEPKDRQEFLDSICDQIVTSSGVGQHAGFPVVEALDEVNASNWSKFDSNGQPIVDANGKIMKGPNYFKADLAQFVPARIPVFDDEAVTV
jgi:hypothetical protein